MAFNNHQYRQGATGEDLIINLLSSFDIPAKKPVPFNKFYDLIIEPNDGVSSTGEVKSDLMGKATGNIALEFWNSKKNEPSGLTATMADMWFHIFCEEVWITNVLDLRVYVQNVKPAKVVFSGGDKNANLYIYKADKIFNDVFTRIDNLDKKKARDIIIKKLSQ